MRANSPLDLEAESSGDWDGHRLLAEVEWTGAHFGPWRSGKTQMQLRHAGGPPKLSLHMESPRHADMEPVDHAGL